MTRAQTNGQLTPTAFDTKYLQGEGIWNDAVRHRSLKSFIPFSQKSSKPCPLQIRLETRTAAHPLSLPSMCYEERLFFNLYFLLADFSQFFPEQKVCLDGKCVIGIRESGGVPTGQRTPESKYRRPTCANNFEQINAGFASIKAVFDGQD